MAPKKRTDVFAQLMKLSVTQSAANTLTFSQLAMGSGVFEYVGLIIERIEYTIAGATAELMTATLDTIGVALTGSDSLTALGTEQPEIYDKIQITRLDQGATPADRFMYIRPTIHDFTGLSGGGLLVPAQDLYIAMESAGLASAGTAEVRVYYRFKELQAAEYLELVQRLRVLST